MFNRRQAMQTAAATTGLALLGCGTPIKLPLQRWHITMTLKQRLQGADLKSQRLHVAARLYHRAKNSVAWLREGYPDWVNINFFSCYGLDIREVCDYEPRSARSFIYTWDVLSQ